VLNAQGFLSDPLKMVPLPASTTTQITLGNEAPVALTSIVNASTSADTIRAVVTAAEKSQPAPTTNKARADALAQFKALQKHIETSIQGAVGVPGDLDKVVSALDAYKWTNVTPDEGALASISDGPMAIRWFQQIDIPNLRTWTSTVSASDLTTMISALTDKTTSMYQRFVLTRVISSQALIDGPWFAGGDDFTEFPPSLSDWLVEKGWLRANLEDWKTVKANSTLSSIVNNKTFVWGPGILHDTRSVSFKASWIWSWPPTQGRKVEANLLSLFVGPVQSGALGGAGGPGWMKSWKALATAYSASRKQIESM
jgi:hypothetical protein